MIRIVIAEDQEMLLETIGALLNLEDDMEVVGQAGNGEEALELVHKLQPDVCIMDIEMPKKNGLEAAEALTPTGCKVIILTTFARNGYFQRAIKADVRGYLLKDSPSEELARSIRSIMDDKRIYASELLEIDERERNKVTFERNEMESTLKGTVRKYFSTIVEKVKSPTG